MGPENSKTRLSQSIAEILGTAEPTASDTDARPGPLRKSLIYTSMALMAINPAAVNAVGIGELKVNSKLGQPLNATVPITLATGESIPKNCVSGTRGDSGLASPKDLVVTNPALSTPGTYNLRVTTANALHEPMYEIALLIDCPGTSLLLRQYVLMLDLPIVASNVATGNTAPVSTQTTTGDVLTVTPADSQTSASDRRAGNNAPSAATGNARRLIAKGDPIPAGQAYRVSSGDTLSTIASRVDARAPDTTWSVANLIFSMNPQAFIRNNPDLIKLGSKIDIPTAGQLARLDRGQGPSVVTAIPEQARTVVTRTENTESQRPAPTPTAVVTAAPVSRPETPVIDTPAPASQPTTTALMNDTAAVPAEPAAAASTQPAPEPQVAPEPVYSSPFLDEVTPPESAATQTTAAEPQPAADNVIPSAVTASEPQTEPAQETAVGSNPLLAILVGILLGMLISLVMFRRQLIDAISDLVNRRSASQLPVAVAKSRAEPEPVIFDGDDNEEQTNTAFDTSEANAVFTKYGENDDQLVIGTPEENTYIVEADDPLSTQDSMAIEESASEPDTDDSLEPTAIAKTNIDLGSAIDPGDADDDEQILSELFDESADNAHLATNDIFDPTGGDDADVPASFIDPTVELPEWEDDDMNLDAEQGLAAATEENLGLEASEQDPVDFLLDQNGDDEMDATTQMMSPGAMDETELAHSLQEAMELLEKDFDEEFTASQLLKRADVADALDDDPTLDMKGDVEEEKIDS